jgi:hypothetical protein
MDLILLLLACLAAISSASFSLWSHDQQPLFSNPKSTETRNFSVGFSLQSSYGAAAVIFEGADGELETHTRVYYGCGEYRRVIAKLSLESSRHIAYVFAMLPFRPVVSANISSPSPPYLDDGQYWADQPRMAARLALKTIGLPASYEVAVLANVIRHLRSKLESDYGISISEAVFTSSHLVALYQDDLEDAAWNVGIKYVTPKSQFQPILWETATAYAGHGLGICEHWQDEDRCKEEEAQLPSITILAVHYSRNALTVSLPKIWAAVAVWEPDYRHIENFTLGSDVISGYSNPEDYWTDVRGALSGTMLEFTSFPKPTKILITGDKAYGYFMEFLEETIKDHIGSVPPIISEDAVVVAAKGAAEFMRRGPAPWS